MSARACPPAEEAGDLVGVELLAMFDDIEVCRFVWDNPRPGERFSVVCPADFICTLALTNQRLRVVLGNGASVERDIVGGTWRYVPAYPMEARHRDPCQLLRDEQDYFGEDDASDPDPEEPSEFLVVPENFTC